MKKILVVDDDPNIVDSIKLLLEMEGYKVETDCDGKTIPIVEKTTPDLILLDIWMSGQDGREICKHLKKQAHTKKIPIIMVSASKDIIDSSKEAGADDFIAKPFEITDLLAKIESHLNQKIN
jgi:DNA-binding response OmpR family regulator